MNDMKKKFLVMIILFAVNTSIAFGTSGKLRSDSIVTCNGVTYGQQGDGHLHIASQKSSGWYPNGGSIYINPCNNESSSNNSNSNNETASSSQSSPQVETPKLIVKSSDTSIKEIKINGTNIEIGDTMNYTTNEMGVDLSITANDLKASTRISDGYKYLTIGSNTIKINIDAEDGSSKEYLLNIYRKSDNTDATFKYIGNNILLVDDVSDKVYVSKKTKKIKLKIKLEDKMAIAI